MPGGVSREMGSFAFEASSNSSAGRPEMVQVWAPMLRRTSRVPDCDMPSKLPPSPSKESESWAAVQASRVDAEGRGVALAEDARMSTTATTT